MESCSNCSMWMYNYWTEDKFGMGVGICELDGSPSFSDHKCQFHLPEEELNTSKELYGK